MQILKVRFLISCLHRFVRVRADMFLFHIVIKQSYKSSVKLDCLHTYSCAILGVRKELSIKVTSFETRARSL